MEQPYLTRLNNLTAAWPSVYNRIDKHRVQVMKFQREPQGGKLTSPALRVRAQPDDLRVCLNSFEFIYCVICTWNPLRSVLELQGEVLCVHFS